MRDPTIEGTTNGHTSLKKIKGSFAAIAATIWRHIPTAGFKTVLPAILIKSNSTF